MIKPTPKWPLYLQGQLKTSLQCADHLSVWKHMLVDLLLAHFACSYHEHMHCVCSEALKGLIPPVKQWSLRQSESALLCYTCRLYLCIWKDHLLQEQPRRIQTTQSAADINLMKWLDRHQTVKIWDKKKKKTTTTTAKNQEKLTNIRKLWPCLHGADSQRKGGTIAASCVCFCSAAGICCNGSQCVFTSTWIDRKNKQTKNP